MEEAMSSPVVVLVSERKDHRREDYFGAAGRVHGSSTRESRRPRSICERRPLLNLTQLLERIWHPPQNIVHERYEMALCHRSCVGRSIIDAPKPGFARDNKRTRRALEAWTSVH